MNKKQITINSKWQKNVKNDYFINDSDTLVIMLPGYGYRIDRPIFHYITGMYFKLKYDILKINYGFHQSQDSFDFKTDYPILYDEIKSVIDEVNHYKKIILIGKSMGTLFIEDLSKQFDLVTKIYLTPTNKTLPDLIDLEALYIYGTDDSLINEESMSRLSGSKRLIVDHANHGLETGDLETDLNNMKRIVDVIREFS